MTAPKEPQPDRRVGLNPTGRPRRSSAASRRKQARRQERGEGLVTDRLSPEREAEIREQFATWPAHATIPSLLAELAAVRAERDCLAMAAMFARQWGGGTPFELHKGIDEILATMPSSGAGETA